MGPFKETISNERKDATRQAIDGLIDDMSMGSSIHFSSSPQKYKKKEDIDSSLVRKASIENTVLMVSIS